MFVTSVERSKATQETLRVMRKMTAAELVLLDPHIYATEEVATQSLQALVAEGLAHRNARGQWLWVKSK